MQVVCRASHGADSEASAALKVATCTTGFPTSLGIVHDDLSNTQILKNVENENHLFGRKDFTAEINSNYIQLYPIIILSSCFEISTEIESDLDRYLNFLQCYR